MKQSDKARGGSSRTRGGAKGGGGAAAGAGGGASTFTADDFVDKAEELMASCQVELSLQFADRALSVDPNSARALECKAMLSLELGKVPDAAALLRRAVQIAPAVGASKYLVLGQLVQGEEAAQLMTTAVKLMEAEVPALRAATGEDAAEVLADRIAEICDALCAIADLYLTDLCDAPTAEASCTECVQRALTYDPNHPQALQTLASIYISTHKTAEALALMQRAVALWHMKVEDAEAVAGPGFDLGGGGGGGAAAAGAAAGAAGVGPARELPPYEVRLTAAKLLMELGQHAVAVEVLVSAPCTVNLLEGVDAALRPAQKGGDRSTLSTSSRCSRLLLSIAADVRSADMTSSY